MPCKALSNATCCLAKRTEPVSIKSQDPAAKQAENTEDRGTWGRAP